MLLCVGAVGHAVLPSSLSLSLPPSPTPHVHSRPFVVTARFLGLVPTPPLSLPRHASSRRQPTSLPSDACVAAFDRIFDLLADGGPTDSPDFQVVEDKVKGCYVRGVPHVPARVVSVRARVRVSAVGIAGRCAVTVVDVQG
jgi:hypothetical protein